MEKGNRVRLPTISIEQTVEQTVDRAAASKARDRLSALASTRTARRISPSSRPGASGTKTTRRAASPKIQTPRSAGSRTDSTPLGPAGPSRAAAGSRREEGVGGSLLRDGLPRADAVAGRRTWDRRRGAEADSFDAAFEAAFQEETRGTRETRDAGSVPRATRRMRATKRQRRFCDASPLCLITRRNTYQSFPRSSRTFAYHVGTLTCDVVVKVLPASPPMMSSSFGTLFPSRITVVPPREGGS